MVCPNQSFDRHAPARCRCQPFQFFGQFLSQLAYGSHNRRFVSCDGTFDVFRNRTFAIVELRGDEQFRVDRDQRFELVRSDECDGAADPVIRADLGLHARSRMKLRAGGLKPYRDFQNVVAGRHDITSDSDEL